MSTAVQPATPLPEELGRNPAAISYSPMLPVEVALATAPIPAICKAYNLTREDWEALRTNPMFIADLEAAREMLRKEGMTFVTKAKLMAEDFLTDIFKIVKDTSMPASVRADLAKSVIRMAGLDQSVAQAQAAKGAVGNLMQIQINLG